MIDNNFIVNIFEKFAIFIFNLKKESENQEPSLNLINQINQKIIFFIENLKKEIYNKHHVYGLESFNNVHYLFLCFADEMFLQINNEEFKKIWLNNLLEKKFYNSSYAGNNIANKINKILDHSLNNQEIKSLIFYMISLGFKSNFNQEKIDSLKYQLYCGINFQEPTLSNPKSLLFKNAYNFINVEFNEKFYKTYNNIFKYLGIFFFIYFIISHTLWHVHLEEIMNLLNKLK